MKVAGGGAIAGCLVDSVSKGQLRPVQFVAQGRRHHSGRTTAHHAGHERPAGQQRRGNLRRPALEAVRRGELALHQQGRHGLRHRHAARKVPRVAQRGRDGVLPFRQAGRPGGGRHLRCSRRAARCAESDFLAELRGGRSGRYASTGTGLCSRTLRLASLRYPDQAERAISVVVVLTLRRSRRAAPRTVRYGRSPCCSRAAR